MNGKRFYPKIVTGNHLQTGRCLFLSGDDKWVRNPHLAQVAHNGDQADKLLERGRTWEVNNRVIEVYLVDCNFNGRPWPLDRRERLRAIGASVSKDQC